MLSPRFFERRVLAFVIANLEMWPVDVVQREDAMQSVNGAGVVLELHVSFVSVNVAFRAGRKGRRNAFGRPPIHIPSAR
jgi:hypothetical protein